ncbi:hypothetical protein PYW08_007718 [Mythimna loreyi]|uniref:Uncharacterized protein n=1 Tax=Mythimna loreyi TaxID=667449 RepID=A0ACC2QF20_9NEOP|nr:hypothetical protein PYW08_007718 [Mythimna loreyi]
MPNSPHSVKVETLPVTKRVPLFQEYRLIERSENEINGAWKGAHLLLFFLAFVFGSFCTFCFHMLMYLFDEKCVLFPKLMSLTSLKHNVIYEFIPSNKEKSDLPVDFLSTQWVEKSTCSLPAYVPLVSGIFGLVWTTMFLMCSTGSRTLTGLQRPWRVLPPVFVFSLAMGGLCVHSSLVTHKGLEELCRKLGEITGSPTCTYTINVATLTYERRIRGVYQATRLTIVSAWLHTSCWLLSALLALIRVLLAVDFLLVKVSVELHGDIDRIMEKNEVLLRSVSPQTWMNVESECASDFIPTESQRISTDAKGLSNLLEDGGDLLYLSNLVTESSEPSLVPDEFKRLALKNALKRVPKDKAFIVKLVYNLVDNLNLPDTYGRKLERTASLITIGSTEPSQSQTRIHRQFGQAAISSQFEDLDDNIKPPTRVDSIIFHQAKKRKGDSIQFLDESSPKASTSKPPDDIHGLKTKSTAELRRSRSAKNIPKRKKRKSNLKAVGVQTDKHKPSFSVHIADVEEVIRIRSDDEPVAGEVTPTKTSSKNVVEKETQTKDKQD